MLPCAATTLAPFGGEWQGAPRDALERARLGHAHRGRLGGPVHAGTLSSRAPKSTATSRRRKCRASVSSSCTPPESRSFVDNAKGPKSAAIGSVSARRLVPGRHGLAAE